MYASNFLRIKSCQTLFLILLLAAGLHAAPVEVDGGAEPRQMLPLWGQGWQFFGGDEKATLPEIDSPEFEASRWAEVSIPHTFQMRGNMTTKQGWYRRKLTISDSLSHKHLYVVFEGATTVSDVFVNGQHLGQHRGGYTRFIFDATRALHVGADNELAVRVDDRPASMKDCLPNVNGLYTVWGGLYRNVWLLATNDLQIDPTYYASPGVFITPSSVSTGSAKLEVGILLRNASSSAMAAKVRATVLDPSGKPVMLMHGAAPVDANGKATVMLSDTIAHPLLWEPATPNLYHVRVDVLASGGITDSVVQPLGFRSMVWDFKAGTLKLDGKPFTLWGADLHQETEKSNYAVQPSELIANFDAMQDLGVNWVRFSHYPRAQIEFDECDRRGIFCWSENGHSHDNNPGPTGDAITIEMVEQNYNHPSIAVWSVGNEGPAAPAEREVPVVKALDPTRPVVVANMKCANADFRATNTYPGWYSGDRWSFKPKGYISEVGAGGAVTSHCDYAAATRKVNSYEPEEYQQLVAETIFELAFRHNGDKLGMFTWWVLREINDTKYKKAASPLAQGINSKGLMTYAGDKKDVFYLYRCFLRPQTPTIWITSKRYFLRQGAVDNGIKVYSNAERVTLTLNGKTVSTLSNGQYAQTDPANKTGSGEVDNVFYWPVPLRTGRNTVTAADERGNADSAVIYFEGSGGESALPEPEPAIKDLASSNPKNPAYFMDMPVQPQWPFYYDFDSTADNSLDLIPSAVQGADWLALHRVTKEGEATDVSFTMAKAGTVYVLCTKQPEPPDELLHEGFALEKTSNCMWRGNDMILVPAELYSVHAKAGEHLKIPLGERDALILLKKD